MRLPVFPNWYPYNDMLLDGRLNIGVANFPFGTTEYAVKTRSWNWNYRGPVLLYTSGRVAREAVDAYGYKPHPSNHGVIIGIADLMLVRNLTNQEGMKMVCNFNNISRQRLNKILAENEYTDADSAFWVSSLDLVEPYRVGFFFANPKRFRKPVSFKWPAGPVKPIFTRVRPGAELDKQIQSAPGRWEQSVIDKGLEVRA